MPETAHGRHIREQWVEVAAEVGEERRPLMFLGEGRLTDVQGEGGGGGREEADAGAAERGRGC
jgi:hypothetical protein